MEFHAVPLTRLVIRCCLSLRTRHRLVRASVRHFPSGSLAFLSCCQNSTLPTPVFPVRGYLGYCIARLGFPFLVVGRPRRLCFLPRSSRSTRGGSPPLCSCYVRLLECTVSFGWRQRSQSSPAPECRVRDTSFRQRVEVVLLCVRDSATLCRLRFSLCGAPPFACFFDLWLPCLPVAWSLDASYLRRSFAQAR